MKKILSIALVFALVFGAVSVFSASAESDVNLYKERVMELMNLSEEKSDDETYLLHYDEVYTYYHDYEKDPTNSFVLISAYENVAGEAFAAKVFGDYIMRSNHYKYPDTFGYIVYQPYEDKAYTLSKAYELGIDGIETVFTEYGLGDLIGDVNYDNKLNIKDATLIQKNLAQLAEIKNMEVEAFIWSDYEAPCFISDYNRDRAYNIKDATAIQKHLAGLDPEMLEFTVSEPVRIPTDTKDHDTYVKLVSSRAELESALEVAYGEASSADEIYTDSYFEEKSIVFILDVIGSTREHQHIDKVTADGNVLTVYRRIVGPSNPLRDINYQYILIELDKESVKNIETIQLLF